jgi:hypothetical protein
MVTRAVSRLRRSRLRRKRNILLEDYKIFDFRGIALPVPQHPQGTPFKPDNLQQPPQQAIRFVPQETILIVIKLLRILCQETIHFATRQPILQTNI